MMNPDLVCCYFYHTQIQSVNFFLFCFITVLLPSPVQVLCGFTDNMSSVVLVLCREAQFSSPFPFLIFHRS